jgi:type I restriction enzyme S subunit
VLWIKKNEAIFDSEYLRNHLRNAFLRNYTSIASGTTFAELKIVNLKNLQVICPPLELQIKFANRIGEIEEIRNRLVHSQEDSAILFASLQHRAFRGEL